MRTFISTLIVGAALLGLNGCKDSTPAAANPAPAGTPNLAEATSTKTAEAVKQQVLDNVRAKADRSVPLENYVEYTGGNQLMFSYLALAGMPVDYPQIARYVSQDYERASDEFQKNDLLNALKPKIDADVAKANTQRYFKISIDNPIQKYDFDNKGFPLDSSLWESGSFRYFGDNSDYKLGFTNGSGFRYLSIPNEDDARKIERLRSTYAGMSLVVYGFMQEADTANKTVKAEIVKVVLMDKKGNVLSGQ
jgi:hypothetical protein